VEVLEMLTQDEIQRAMYEDREKARRDAASWQSALEHWKHEAASGHAKGRAEGRAEGELIGEIRAYERVLGQNLTPEDQLSAMSLDELTQCVQELEAQMNGDGQA